jgi:hypothetical protein
MKEKRILVVLLALGVFALLLERVAVRETKPAFAAIRPAPAGNKPGAGRDLVATGKPPDQIVAGGAFQDQAPAFAEAAGKLLNSEATAMRDQALARLLQDWVACDPLAAANFAQAIGPPGLREKMRRLVLQAWTALDSASALSWAARLAAPYEHQVAMEQVLSQMLERDPQGAMETAISRAGETPADLSGRLIQQWAAQDFSAAHDWVRQQPSGEQRDGLLALMAFVQSKTDPVDAAELVSDEIAPGDNQVEAALWVLDQWALNDPEAASAWLNQFPAGPIRDRARDELSHSINQDQ